MLLMFVGIVCLAGAAYLIGEALTLSARERNVSVRRAAMYGRIQALAGAGEQPFGERVLVPMRNWLARVVLRAHPKTSLDSVSAKLLAAGLGRTLSPTGFLSLKAVFAAGGLLLGAVLGGASSGAGGLMLMALVFGGVGFLMPDTIVSMKARKRKEQIKTELPDALDLLAVSVEAGLGFDGAISKLTDYMDGPLAEEFALTLSEIRIGESRQDALKKLSTRTGTQEVSTFVRAIIQADQLGISLGRILKVQAADTRLRRQAAAEEKAMKAPIKMLFPTVLFIFPAMFLVILGPAFLNLTKVF